ncbi:hypothetical protein HYALB_00009462 [Hymenoscyphus albidus]|uniref:Glutathione hydrolase n=1 Tax=Hymenoscyphus albidus TaxID=595503 RepID=A0A9N9Q965_9HELO|nr:hypothetical protein HYALB_00009462 [Hymenoscyphus albidus]
MAESCGLSDCNQHATFGLNPKSMATMLSILGVLYFLGPAMAGRALSYYLTQKTAGRRAQILELMASEEKDYASKNGRRDSDEWDYVEAPSGASKGASPADRHWDGIVGFFHPFCNAGGGGERVLWAAIRATQQRWPKAKCIVYTGDHEVAKEEILDRVKTGFDIQLHSPTILFLYLTTRDWVLPSSWPVATLAGQSLGSLVLAWDAFSLLPPDIFVDTMGYAFALWLCKFLFKDVPTGAYVHYPIISSDMLGSLDADSPTGNFGVNAGKGAGWWGKGKKMYWRGFAWTYSLVGSSIDVVMTNSTWTQAHITTLWGPRRNALKKPAAVKLLPPVNVDWIEQNIHVTPESEKERQKALLYVGQFRPEKNHKLILSAFAEFMATKTPATKGAKLILVGSVRDDADSKRVYELRLLANELQIKESVEFHLDVPFKGPGGLEDWLRVSSIGVNGMWNEHFGIGVVEYQAAGLICVVHNSGGPKLDIVTEIDGKPTGFHATTSTEFANGFEQALALPDKLAMRKRARQSAKRFTEEEFVKGWIPNMEQLVALHPIWLSKRRTSLLTLGLALTSCVRSVAPENDTHGAVSSESHLCSEIGIDILKRGGNAADAMVATTLCVGVVSPQHSGIGGGGFMLVRGPNGVYESIDFRETAPAAAWEGMYEGNVEGSVWSGLASGVPGDVRGLEGLWVRYGKLPWRAICNPAVHVARYGFPVTEDLARYMDAATHDGNDFFTEDPQWAIDFAPNGTRLGIGDILTRKRYANTLETIAKHGSKGFYEGDVAKYNVAALQAANGTMTLEDVKNYQISIRDPISIFYRGYKLTSCGAPSGGSVALSILKIIEGYNLSNSEDWYLNTHRLNEAMRFSYAARAELGDPAFFSFMDDFEAKMLQPKTASDIRHRISDSQTHNISYYSPKHHFLPENHGTSHVVTTDDTGLSITLTSTVNLLFGSQLVVPETGVVMNNEMNDFSIPGVPNAFGFVPSPINYIRPHKRPLSSVSPIIVEHPDGTPYLTIGAAGGSRIITATAQSVMYVLDRDMTLPEALKQPRIHDQLLPAVSVFEWAFDNRTVEDLRGRGHNVTWVGPYLASVQGVRRLANGTFEAGSEPRQRNSGGLAC